MLRMCVTWVLWRPSIWSQHSDKPNAELTAAMCKLAREKGLILIACGFYGNTLRFLMPVTIEEEVLDEGLAIVEACLAELAT